MQSDWVVWVVIATFILFFVWLAVAFLRKSRARRQEQFRETSQEELEAKRDEQELLRESREEEERRAPARRVEPKEQQKQREQEARAAEAERRLEPGEVIEIAPKPAVAPPPARPRPAEDEALKQGLARTSSSLRQRLSQIFGRHPEVDPAALDELEEALLTADVGVGLTARLLDGLRAELAARKLLSREDVHAALATQMRAAFDASEKAGDPMVVAPPQPRVILFVGVNGAGY